MAKAPGEGEGKGCTANRILATTHTTSSRHTDEGGPREDRRPDAALTHIFAYMFLFVTHAPEQAKTPLSPSWMNEI